MSLRDDLLGQVQGEPPFGLILPPGWREYRPDEGAQASLLKQASARLKAHHRPDLYGQLQMQVRRAFETMRRRETLAFYLQLDAPDDLIAPMTITASRVRARDAGNLDADVATLIRDHGAERFTDDSAMIRWVVDGVTPLAGERTGTRSIGYLTPVPGTGRRSAVQLTTVIAYPIDTPPDDEFLEQLSFISDAIAATFQWFPR